MKAFYLCFALFLSLSATIAKAGDPCPIRVNLIDLGSPDWLDNDALLDALTSQRTWIGIRHADPPEEFILRHIYRNSPAERAGLQQDDIVSTINGLPVKTERQKDAVFDSIEVGTMLEFSIERNGERQTIDLEVGHADPVVLRALNALKRQDCRNGRLTFPTSAEREHLLPKLFTDNRGFRCEDAHLELRSLGERYEIDQVYFVRGSRRILITMPYWGTTCVQASALDGNNLTDQAVLGVLDRVIGDYIDDRHANP